uniref:Uncharacterized protein n=1 Tax=Lepeophtheirus salmonis TaxID=72036 RepID=A0A0K2TDK5_LEPSM
MRRSRDDSYQDAVEKLKTLLDDSNETTRSGTSLREEEGPLSHNSSLSDELSLDEKKSYASPKLEKLILRRISSSSRIGIGRHRSRRFGESIHNNGRDMFKMNKRHNSWHNLIKFNDENEGSHQTRNGEVYDDVVGLVKKQECYIKQLEGETNFSRDKLNKLLLYTKDLLENKNEQDKSFQTPLMEGLKDTDACNEVIMLHHDLKSSTSTFKLENFALKKKVEAIQESEKLKEQSLRKEISVLSESLNHLRSEFDEVTRRESEAVEQVKRSVEVAEQVRLEKTDLEFEIGQLKLQIERQQARIRSLIEEQVIKSEEERNFAEKKYKNQLTQIKEEFQAQVGESSRIISENEKLKNTQNELGKNLEDRDKLIQNLRSENDKRIADLQLEIVSTETRRQKSDQELALLKLDFESVKHDLKSERSRLDSEVRSYKSRISRTEEMLTLSREENLRNVERNATLEREVNLMKLSHEHSTKDNSSNALLESYVKECDSERRTHRLIVERLEELVRRQSRIIGELKSQCNDLTEKLESISKDKLSVSTERDDLRSRLIFLEKKNSESELQLQKFGSEIQSLQDEIDRKDVEMREMEIERNNFLIDQNHLIDNKFIVKKADKRCRRSLALNSSAITIIKKNQTSSPKRDDFSRK